MTTSGPTALEEALRNSTADLSLDRDLDGILRRGEHLRRSRRRRTAAGGVAAAVVGATAVSLTLPGGSSPVLPRAEAAWGPELVSMSVEDLGPAERQCRRMLAGMGWELPADAAPLAADARGEVAIIVYRVGDQVGDCHLDRTRAGFAPASASVGGRWAMPAGRHVTMLSMSAATGTSDGPVRQGAGGFRVSDAVERVEIDYAGQTLEAQVDSGVAMFWLPDGASQAQLDAAVVTALDAAGTVLFNGTTHEFEDGSAPNDDQHR